MGIRFYCPSGHKLNVKDFQAGRTGICPHCGAKLRIPLESTRPSSRSRKSRSKKTTAGPTTPIAGGVVSPPPSSPPGAPMAFDVTSAGPAGTQTAPFDPLAEAGDVVWYVRPTSGGQFGPANSDVMRAWLTEGRVNSDALVWREGWREWQEAGNVFPQLAPAQAFPGLDDIPLIPITIPGHNHPVKHNKKAHSTRAVVIGSLAVVAAAILAGFLLVLLNQ
jgi:hypothetical protein